MQFILPSKYTSLTEAPKPTNKLVHLVKLPERLLAVDEYTGWTNPVDTSARAVRIAQAVEAAGFKVVYTDAGQPKLSLARYNPPWTIPWLRRNEVQVVLQE